MEKIKDAEKVVRRLWSFSRALDLALIDEEVKRGFKIDVGYRHGERVGYMCVRLGRIMGLSDRDQFLLLIAGLLHDIGAVGSFADFHGDERLMQVHAETGAAILGSFPCGDILSEALRYHHDTPENCCGESIMAHIISVADKIDIIMGRKKNTFRDRAKILNYMNSLSGVEFFPDVTQAFIQLAGEEAFWLYLNEGELLEPTLSFMFGEKTDLDCSELDGICDFMFGERFTAHLAETFAFLIDQKSTFTGTHSRSVSEIAAKLAHAIGWSDRECDDIRFAGLLHDLGKLAVPQKVLDKPGPLNDEEVQAIRTHTYYTYNLLSSADFPKHIVEWAAYHHERLDGRGYPFRIPGSKLSVGCRLMTIADMYTALTEDRPYRKGMPSEKAMEIIEYGIGKSVDEELVQVAKRVLL